jgi:hypothetical protein
MPDDAGYVLVKGDQGLGNRILCLLSAVLLAQLTGRRIAVDWRDPLYSTDGGNAFERLLRVAAAVPLHEVPDADSVRPAIWRGHLHQSAAAMRRRVFDAGYADAFTWEPFCTELGRIDYPERVLVFVSYFERIDPLRRHLGGAHAGLSALSTAEILRRLWRGHLALAPDLEERVEDFRRTRLRGETLGVHVRASDRRTRAGAIEARAARLVRRHPHLRIFLATDNVAVLRRWTERFGDVVATEKWYPPPGRAMHAHPAHPDPTAGAADALVDMHLLAACDRLIVDSRSSFGRLAALRSGAPAARIVDLHPCRLLPSPVRRSLLRLDSVLRRRRRGIAPPP